MFQSEELSEHLNKSHTVRTESLVLAEWNLNDFANVERLGNYRYRPGTTDNLYSVIPATYDELDNGSYYTGATDSDVSIQVGFDEDDEPTFFSTKKEKMNYLYSLEDCIRPDRPRSGINKLLYLGSTASQYLDIGDKATETQEVVNIARRPRYYMSSKRDQFKYWTSFRTASDANAGEVNAQVITEFGVARQLDNNGISYIYDAAPFVVYKNSVAANRIVVKMQTNVGDVDLGPFRNGQESFADPLFGAENQTTPQRWSIEVLKGDNWVTAISFDENSTDSSGERVIKSDGYVEIAYGLIVPDFYRNFMIYGGELEDVTLLPDEAPYGYTFLIKSSEEDRGTLYFYDASSWIAITPEYGWFLNDQELGINTSFVTKLSNPDYFLPFENSNVDNVVYREFEFIRGIRIVVKTMNKPECTFDLIEMSPRLVADLTDKVTSFSITKQMADLGNSSVPVGNIFASTGSIEMFDDDFSFSANNPFDFNEKTGSIITDYIDSRCKFNFYQVIKYVDSFNYYVPLKTLYADQIPAVSSSTGLVSFTLRDKFYFLESSPAPEMLIADVSISYAVSLLLDNIGFSNYVFKRIDGKPEMIIPFFFVGPNQNVAEALADLAIASQTAMFFDEYNNFVVMSKEYLLPDEGDRNTDLVLYGQKVDDNLPNIINVSSEEKKIFNEGRINYTTRYLQRQISRYKQIAYIDKYKTFGYKPSLLWEVDAREKLRSQNETTEKSQGFALAAIPLNSDLTGDVPTVSNQQIINNVMDFGDGVEGIGSYKGYFYANGEIIRYDAVEYAYTGPLNGAENIVWITNDQEYQKYFSRLPFNGKMYPTGNVRIFCEPEYVDVNGETKLQEGAVKKHGRGQFGTPVSSHPAGLDPYWSNNLNVKGCVQEAKEYLFSTDEIIEYPELFELTAGKIVSKGGIARVDADKESTNSSRIGIIKNHKANKYYTEKEQAYFDTSRAGTLQSSALVFEGPELPSEIAPSDFISYVHKPLDKNYKHFGTRMRIIGQITTQNSSSQKPIGAFPIFQTQNLNVDSPDKTITISGGTGGIAFGLNPKTNLGYYFEIVSLTQDNVTAYNNANKETPVTYTILADPKPSCVNNIVTVHTLQNVLDDIVSIPERPIPNVPVKLQVGEKITISGLVDSLNPTDTNTPLNGEYEIVAINKDGKSFQYQIPGASIPNRTSNTGGKVTKSTIGKNVVSNIYFYKVMADKDGKAVPYRLWSGIANISADDGRFTGQYRMVAENNPTVYDLAAEYINIGTTRRFYLYINNKQVATVDDPRPLPEYNNMALFIRGSSKCMFENIYAIGANISQNSKVPVARPISKIWGDNEIDTSEALRKYAISGMIQKTYLSGIGSEQPPSHVLYFDEFGTIMREVVYFNIKYDRSYPALYAEIMKTFNRLQGYTISGFYAGSYGADFLVFNCLDTTLALDDTTGNFLRIQGITFTQNTTKTLTVDDYYRRLSTFSDPIGQYTGALGNPFIVLEEYNSLLNSRSKYGVSEFTIESPFIQTDDVAEEILGWTIKKVSKQRLVVGLNVFGGYNVQLGDLVQINYKNNDGLDVITSPEKKFVVYNIEYKRDPGGDTTTLYLVEA